MTRQGTGWLVFIAAIGMMCGLMSSEIRELMHWSDATTPGFVAVFLAHFATVITAFIAGKIIPSEDK